MIFDEWRADRGRYQCCCLLMDSLAEGSASFQSMDANSMPRRGLGLFLVMHFEVLSALQAAMGRWSAGVTDSIMVLTGVTIPS